MSALTSGLVRFAVDLPQAHSSATSRTHTRTDAALSGTASAAADATHASSGALFGGGMKLLQVDDALLAYIERGGRLAIKGGGDAGAVLCSRDTTYALTLVESSNTLLCARTGAGGGRVADGEAGGEGAEGTEEADAAAAGGDGDDAGSSRRELGAAYDIFGSVNGHLELRAIAPPVYDIRAVLLAGALYAGDENEPTEASSSPSAGRKRVRSDSDDMETDTHADDGRREAARKSRLGHSIEELEAIVPCSEDQLRSSLRALGALVIRDRVRLLDRAYIDRVLDAILLSAEAQGMPLHKVDVQGVVTDLRDRFPPPVVQHVLALHANGGVPPLNSSYRWPEVGDAETEYDTDPIGSPPSHVAISFTKLSERIGVRVLHAETLQALQHGASAPCATAAAAAQVVSDRYTAESLLRGAAALAPGGIPWLAADKFMERWKQAMPEGAVAGVDLSTYPAAASGAAATDATGCTGILSLSTLVGLHVVSDTDAATKRVIIRVFPREELAPQPAARFKQLFAVRPRWLLGDLQPFLAPLEGHGVKVADLLLAHTRNTLLPDGVTRLFSAR